MEAQVLKALESVSKEVKNTEELSKINSGGCAWMAAYIKLHLDELGVPSQIIHIESWDHKFKTPTKLVKAIYDPDKTTSASHVILHLYGKYFYDSAGWGTKKEYYTEKWGKYLMPFDMPVMDYIIYNLRNKPSQWNSVYEVNKCNKILFDIIKRAFEPVFESNKQLSLW